MPNSRYYLLECLTALKNRDLTAHHRVRWAGKMLWRAMMTDSRWDPSIQRRAEEILREYDWRKEVDPESDDLAAAALCHKMRRFVEETLNASPRQSPQAWGYGSAVA